MKEYTQCMCSGCESHETKIYNMDGLPIRLCQEHAIESGFCRECGERIKTLVTSGKEAGPFGFCLDCYYIAREKLADDDEYWEA